MSSGSREDIAAPSPFADPSQVIDAPPPATTAHDAPETPGPDTPLNQPGNLDPPTPMVNRNSFAATLTDTGVRNSYVVASPSPSSSRPMLFDHTKLEDSEGPAGEAALAYKESRDVQGARPTSRRRRLYIWLGVGIAAIVIIVLAVVLPVVLTKSHSGHSGNKPGGGSGSNPESPTGAVTGGDGSTVVMSDGTSFTYTNKFGGFWVDDPKDPFNNSARAQSFTKSLAEPWDYSTDQIRGVNLGGWLVLEPFIVPSLFEKYQNVTPTPALPTGQAVDEWSLSIAMLNDTTEGGGIGQIEDHYKTFITEQDFAAIAGAGLNWVRLPVPYWAIETWPGEPFLANKAWDYVLLAIQWARKYGLRMYLELHTVPGSQNGYNHSGRLGPINFLNGYMGIANAQRTMDYVRFLTEFFSQEGYSDVVQIFGPINEPLLGIIGRDQLTRFYLQAHDIIRNITGIGKGPYIAIHDGFQSDASWKDFLPGSDRIMLDTHPYVAFGGDFNHPLDYWPQVGCVAYTNNQSQSDFGITISGEFSGAINNCGKWVLNVGQNSTLTDCPTWDDWQTWTDDMKTGIKNFVMSQMNSMALPGYFYWTWKVGNSSVTGKVEAPFWSYSLGLQNGWIPDDPRSALGLCVADGFPQNVPWDGQYQPWQTGGSGAGTIAATALASFSQYPPPAISNVNGADPAQLPMYTPTNAPITLPPPTFTGATVTAGDGWADPQDTSSKMTEIAGCVYPNVWGPAPDSTQVVCGGSTVAVPAGTAPAAATTTSAPAAATTAPA